MADLVLYTNPVSRGRIARWMIEEVGAPYETVPARGAFADYRGRLEGREAWRRASALDEALMPAPRG